MKVDELKKYIKRAFKGKISITHGMIIALILGVGMYGEVNAETIINNDTIDYTMSVANGDEALNYGIINVDEIYGKGMYASNGSTAINGKKGKIYLNITDGIGMHASNESTVTNNGTINVDESYGKGMYASNGSTAINGNKGKIYLNSPRMFGMYASNESTVTNNGTINVDEPYGRGMYVYNGSTAINGKKGKIYLNSTYGIGMYATGEGSTIENRGKIYLSGIMVAGGFKTSNDGTTWGPLYNGLDHKVNIGMLIEDGARMINSGQIVFGSNK